MITKELFSDIRPYLPHEVPAAIDRMIQHKYFHIALNYLFPKDEHASLLNELKNVQTGFEFQKVFMYKAISRVLEKSSDGFQLKNKEYLQGTEPAVFVSNHRDILLDSAILQMILVDLGLETSEITFGSNLMISDFIIDFGKVNRMFTVYREGTSRQMLENAKQLSSYFHHNISEKKVSSWIAQRKGRTKDGLDKTDSGVLKMLTMYDRKNPIEAFLQLNIIPISVAYEWEPCDFAKVRELYLSDKHKYVKQADEDLMSVIHGIVHPKGRVSIAIGKPVKEFIQENLEKLNSKNIHHEVALFMDEQIYSNYQLYPNNYLAFDLLNEDQEFDHEYSMETKDMMEGKLKDLYQFMGEESAEIRERYLQLYANPLIKKLKVGL